MTREVTSLLGRLPASYARRGGGVLRRYLAIAEGLVADFERLDSSVARERAVAALVPSGPRGGADLRRGPVPAPAAIWPALVVRESGGRLVFHRTFDRAVILAWSEAALAGAEAPGEADAVLDRREVPSACVVRGVLLAGDVPEWPPLPGASRAGRILF